jgi:hypothetical protein
MYEGGCACGAVRYRITAETRDVTHCHCTICRRTSGAPFVTWLTVPASAFTILAGRPAERRSSPQAVRTFCATCGTALTFREAERPRSIDVTAGSLDAPDLIAPRDHTFVRSKLPWIPIADGLPQHEAANPGERDVD